MYKTILVTLDGTPTDRAIIEHIKQLAKLAHSRIVLLHVADGWAARTYGPDAISPEITEDTAYLEKVRAEFQSAGISAEAELAYGDPAMKSSNGSRQKGCDLVAMSTHGHGFLADLFLGSASRRVRHRDQRARAAAAGKVGAEVRRLISIYDLRFMIEFETNARRSPQS